MDMDLAAREKLDQAASSGGTRQHLLHREPTCTWQQAAVRRTAGEEVGVILGYDAQGIDPPARAVSLAPGKDEDNFGRLFTDFRWK